METLNAIIGQNAKKDFSIRSTSSNSNNFHKQNLSKNCFSLIFYLSFLVLPTFQVSIELANNFILPNDEDIRGMVKAVYRYGLSSFGRILLNTAGKTKDYTGRLRGILVLF